MASVRGLVAPREEGLDSAAEFEGSAPPIRENQRSEAELRRVHSSLHGNPCDVIPAFLKNLNESSAYNQLMNR